MSLKVTLVSRISIFISFKCLKDCNSVLFPLFSLKSTTDVTSGTFGSLEYPDINGENQDLWINYDSDKSKYRVPVPKYYWKVLYDAESHSGVAFLGLNDIYSPGSTQA